MLKAEERLAIPHARHERHLVRGGYSCYWTNASKFALMNRLGEYEDLGYTPEELREIIETARKASEDA